MYVMTVCALDHTFVHGVMEHHIELRLRIVMTLEAKRGLRRLEQRLFLAACECCGN